jgi:Icc-related predicted phosphoesterase
MSKNKLSIVAISDLHGYLPLITKPAEIMLIAGDISPLEIQKNIPKMKTWLETEFIFWVKNLPVNKVIMVAGNHDLFFEKANDTTKYMLEILSDHKLKYLENQNYIYNDKNGIHWKIFGTPFCHVFGSWSFMVLDEYMDERFKEIPDIVDIIISHDPPYGSGTDQIWESKRWSNQPPEFVGNKPLANRLSEIEYGITVVGHIHSGSKVPVDFNSGKCVNVSIKDENYNPTYQPFYYTLEK